MKKIIKTLLVVMVLVLALAVFTACEKTDCDHNYVQEFLPGYDATCTTDGLRPGYKCSNCGEVTKEQVVVPAYGHNMAEATCTAPSTCTRGDCTYTEGEALGHSFTIEVEAKDATCLDGYTAHKECDRCGAKNEEYEVLPGDNENGHEFNEDEFFYYPSAPTCTEGAYIAGYCVYCEGGFILDEVAPLGHTWVGGDCTTPATCSVCEAEGEFVHNVGEDGVCADCGIVFVSTQAELQAALDNAVKGTTIQLMPNVSYGVVYLRPSANEGVTKVVDWVGNNYRYETYSLFEDLTILGAEGATIDAIEIEGGTYYNTEHSQSETYPIMLSLIELKNVLIEGVTFTGNGGYDPQNHGNVINLSGGNIKVDGLTLENCVLDNEENNARLIYKTESTTTVHKYEYEGVEYTFSPTLKNITVTGCTFNGGYMGLELRETENVTITNNEFNVADRNILLAVNTGCTYTGTITITGNVSNGAAERFVRGDGIGDATLVITGNTINDYVGEDLDYIKVTGATGTTTVENNTITDGSEEGNREFTVVVQ